MTLQQNHVRPITLVFKVGFRNYFTEVITIFRRRVAYNIWVATFKVKVTARPCRKNRVRSITLLFEVGFEKIFHRNDHHIETTCRAQYLGRYLEGQGQSMTLQQNRVQPIASLFEVGFQKYFTEMITILRRRVARNIWVATLKVKVKA